MQNVRLFIAIELTQDIKDKLKMLEEELCFVCPQGKWVKPDNIHLTLNFLGYIKEDLVRETTESIIKSVKNFGSFDIEVKGASYFPEKGDPRVIWVGIGSGSEKVFSLHSKIKEALLSFNFEPEKDEFKAHLTLGRIKDPKDTKKLVDLLALKESSVFGKYLCDHISIIKSDLKQEGVSYTVLKRIKL